MRLRDTHRLGRIAHRGTDATLWTEARNRMFWGKCEGAFTKNPMPSRQQPKIVLPAQGHAARTSRPGK